LRWFIARDYCGTNADAGIRCADDDIKQSERAR
jgi:hypothetical protein